MVNKETKVGMINKKIKTREVEKDRPPKFKSRDQVLHLNWRQNKYGTVGKAAYAVRSQLRPEELNLAEFR